MFTEMGPFMAWVDANPLLFVAIILWSMIWKGFALWRAGGLRHKGWFIAILLLNTFGFLEIYYLFVVARKYEVEVVESD
jgi:hypothetical protein